nr:hypothetical protein IMFVHALQ_IMFVHALQ_CDS_0002 [Microvirus sp.]
MISQPKNKIFPNAPYDMYSHFQPVYGYFVDNDEKSDTFGSVLFGQIGEKDLFSEVQSYKEDCDMSFIKEELLRQSSADDWSCDVPVEIKKEINEDEFNSDTSSSNKDNGFKTSSPAGDKETVEDSQENAQEGE